MTAEQAIGFALDARDVGHPKAGVEPLREALAREPSNPRLWQTLGGIYRAMEHSAAAIEAFERAARYAPADARALHGVAQASLEAGRPAVALFDRALRATPGDGTLRIGRAAAQLAEGRGLEAITDLEALTAANPLWIDGHATLARLRWQLGQADRFDASYAISLVQHPRAPQLWLAWVHMLAEVEAWERCAAVIERAKAAIGVIEPLVLQAAQCASEMDDVSRADGMFAALPVRDEAALVELRTRHALRNGRIDAAAALIGDMRGAASERLWPYASIVWRLTDDPRSDWLDRGGSLAGVYEIAMDGALAGLATYLRGRHHAIGAPAGQSVRGGTQTDGPLFALEAVEIRALRRAVTEVVDAHVATLGALDPHHPTLRRLGKPRRFAGSWSVRLSGAGHHSAHIHAMGWLSSALYVAVPPQADMGAAPNGWLQLGQPPAALACGLAPQREVEPLTGRLVLFPSWMWHGTHPIAGGERLTVAFDVATVG